MIKTVEMTKPTVKVSVSDSEESSVEESGESDNEVEMAADEEAAGSDEADVSSDADESSDDENSGEEGNLVTNEGWRDSVAKILSSSKPKNKKTLVLSRAKKHSEVVKPEVTEKPAFEIIGENKEEKPVVKEDVDAAAEPPAKKKKHEKAPIRVKPNILEKDRERLLSKIATKGVVQLFNAVRNQQKSLGQQIDRNDITEGAKEKILKKFDKRAFLDTLMGQTKSVVVDEATKKYKDEVKDEEKPRWNALRDDFMMGAKMKDWNKESDDEQ
ncbi:unnamed protein product [Plutella xylostella]|uniref:RRP15-like protein n=1 Tax=Plutella xylostella TaxID=51655 RepID=A0A8S4FX08_PLUXY|nr:unnamed protein product [Plutella xylostella]